MLGKRKRSPQECASMRQVLTEQIDLEIALKKRLAVAAQARLEWAKLLRSSIDNPAADVNHGHPPNAFRDAALVAYENIEAPCHVISSTGNLPPILWPNGKPQILPAVMAPEAPRTRKRITLGLAQSSSADPILFEDRSRPRPVTLKLVCTDCSRSDFPTMQGLLNHCRLAHSRVYGTHDECIQATGVIVDSDEREALLASGVEINTVHLPSLKSMFERAVGLTPTAVSSASEVVVDCQSVEESLGISTHLSQTLGYHKDTPTLAPFLGRQPKRKCIHVYDDSGPIDITSHDDEMPLSTRISSFIKRQPRRGANGDWSINLAALAAEKTNDADVLSDMPTEPLDSITRFHVTRRILVSDRSLYLLESKRPAVSLAHTHRWQISVSSPSYSQHVTTFLSCLVVTCVTQPPVFTSPILISEPPFIACSTTDRPFLARLTLDWVGEHNHAFEVDHWVELDQQRSARPALGDEQMIDVELDRKTVFLPVQDTVNTVSWNGDGDYMRSNVVDSHSSSLQHASTIHAPSQSSPSEPEHVKRLKGIVPRFPMTMQDLGTRKPSVVPYILYPSRVKLLNLVPGRRKAIEWSRALAIRTEYDTLYAFSASEDRVNLTTADVYRWLDAEGFFPRPRRRAMKPPTQITPTKSTSAPSQPLDVPSRFCSVCGVSVHHHTPGVRVVSEDSTATQIGFQCSSEMERRRTPIIHVYTLLAPSRTAHWTAHSGRTSLAASPRDLVTIAHPQLTRLVRQEIASLYLSCSGVMSRAERDPQLLSDSGLPLGRNRREVDRTLSTHAFLAITLEQLMKDLVRGALQAARDMQSHTNASSYETPEDTPALLLTPTHVLQGLQIKEADLGGPKEALFKYLSRVGTLLAVGTATHSSGVQHPQVVYGTRGAA